MTKINFIHIPKNGGTSLRKICDKNKKILKYNGHETDVSNNNLINQLIIIRNPIDRFISAVSFSLQKFSHEPHVKYLIENKIDTPEKWVKIWMNSKNNHYPYLMNMIKNSNHKIGNRLIKYKWTYSQQSLWINKPKFIIIMDNFEKEINYLLQKYNLKGVLKKCNSTKDKKYKLSQQSIQFLKDFYKKDFVIYEKYKKMKMEERL